MRGILRLSILTLCLVLVGYDASAHREPATFVYYVNDEAAGKSTLHFLDTTTFEETTVEAPLIKYVALSPYHPRLAYTDQEGWVHVLNVATRTTTKLDIQLIVTIELFYDRQTFFSGSMSWAPDGTRLAFAGRDANDTVGVFVYSEANGEVVNVTGSDREFLNDVVEVSSWSPDGEWLAVSAIWNERVDLALVSSDGSRLVELRSNDPRFCRVQWSPNMQYMLAEHGCYRNYEQELPIVLIEFDRNLLTLRDISSRIETEITENYFVSREFPVWLGDQTIRYVRYGAPKWGTEADTWVFEIIQSDIETGEFVVIYVSRDQYWQEQLQPGVVLGTRRMPELVYEAYDLTENSPLFAIEGDGYCVWSKLWMSRQANLVFVAGGGDCSTLTPRSPINLFDLESGDIVFEGGSAFPVWPIGFTLTQLVPEQ